MRSRLVVPSRTAALAVVVTLAAAACGLGPGATGSPPASTPPGASPGASAAASGGPGGSPPAGGTVIPEPILAQVIQDAASLTGGEPSGVVVVEARSVTWPNGAAGCPQPDMGYTDALVPGYWVVVESAGRTLDYRGSHQDGSLQLCENPEPVPESSGAT